MPLGTILMVEPNPGILIVARNVLTRAGLSVEAVSQPSEAVDLIKERTFDLAILDAAPPCLEVTAALERSAEPPPVILTVAKCNRPAADELLEALLKRGPAELLDKPFAPDGLLTAVRAHLSSVGSLEELNGSRPSTAVPPPEGEAFPFAELLQDEVDSLFEVMTDPEARPADRLAVYLHDALAESDVHLTPRELDACLRACETALAAEAPNGGGTPVAVTGSLQLLPIDQLLQLAAHVDPPAQCRLENAGAVVDVFYRGPRVVFARQDNLPPGFMLGSFLVAAQVVTEREVQSVLEPSSGQKGWIGQRLISAGLVEPEVVEHALRRQTEELIYELVRWKQGRFRIFAQASLPASAQSAELSIPVEHLLLEGMRRLDEWRLISSYFDDLDAVIAPLVEPSEVLEGLPPADRSVLEKVDGERTVSDLVHTVPRPSFEVFRSLHNLQDQNLVALRAS